MVGRGSVGMSPPRGCPGTPRIFDAEAPTLSPEGNSPPGGGGEANRAVFEGRSAPSHLGRKRLKYVFLWGSERGVSPASGQLSTPG